MKTLLSAAAVLAALALSPALAQAQEGEHQMPAAAPGAHAAPAKPAMGEGCKGGMSGKMGPGAHGTMGPPAGHGSPAPMSSEPSPKAGMEKGCGSMKGKSAGHGMSMQGHAMPMGKDKAAPMEHEVMPEAAPKPKVATPK